jgi:transcriptional regulator
MSIYVPAHFKVDEAGAMRELIREHPFATLVTAAQPEPLVSHVPLLMADERTLIGHFARANPHAKLEGAQPSIAIFHGPHAYVSPSWYAEPDRAVPTWNYATVHVRGVLEPTDDLGEAQKVLDALIARFEGTRREPWSFRLAEPQRTAMLKAIRAFRFRIEDITGKFKMSQNRSADDRKRVMSALREEGYAEASATAEWMEKYARP